MVPFERILGVLANGVLFLYKDFLVFFFQLCSAQNWKYAAKEFLKKYPEDVIAHCEFHNPSFLPSFSLYLLNS